MGRAHEVRKASMEKSSKIKSKLYSKFGKEIYMAAKNGGTDLDSNLELKRLIDRAKQNQVPSHVIEKNIEKSKSVGGEDYFPVRYEGFGPGGSSMIVECISDNVNRTVSEVRKCFTKVGGHLGKQNTVAYMYQHAAVVVFKGMTADDALEALMMAEVDCSDIQMDDDIVTIIGDATSLYEIKEAIQAANADIEFISDDIAWIANNDIDLEAEELNLFAKFIAMAEDVEDVQEIYHNVGNLPEEDQ